MASHAPARSGGAHQANPQSTSGRGHSRDHLHESRRDEIHGDRQRRARDAEIEVSRHREIVREFRVLEMSYARGPHARGGEPVVEPGGGPAPEVRADGVMERRQDLEQHEDDPHQRQREQEILPALHGAHDRSDGDGKRCGEHPRRTSTPHQAMASVRSARGRIEQNFQLLLSTRRSIKTSRDMAPAFR